MSGTLYDTGVCDCTEKRCKCHSADRSEHCYSSRSGCHGSIAQAFELWIGDEKVGELHIKGQYAMKLHPPLELKETSP
jgi:hypothetical protein